MLYDLAGNTLVEYRGWQSAVQQAYATYSYGADSEKLSVADANGNLTGFGYDGFNRLTATTYPDSTAAHPDVETLAYDKDSNITARTTRAGQVLNYTFDAIDRMTKKTVPAVGAIPAVESDWAYYLNGAVKELDDFLNGSGTKNNDLTYGYDSAGRMTSTSTTIPGISGSLVTGYVLDLDGNRTQLTWPDGYFVTYAYDSLDRMTSATEGGGSALATYSYDTLSRRTNVTFQGGGNMAYVYTPAGDLTALNDTVPGTGSVPHFTLGYTPAHQLASEASSDPTYLLQLASTGTDSYAAPNSLNQVTTINSASASGHDCQGNAQQYSYDCNGNLTGDGTWSYAYDPENRLITAGKTSGGTVSATYNYDPLGRRTHKSGTGVTETYFLSDGSDEIAEYDASGSGVPVNRFVPGPAINDPAAQIIVAGTHRRFFLTDHHGSVVAMVNASGNQVEGPYTYDAYGNCFTAGAACATSGTPYRFVGMRLDPETGLYYDRARYYSASIGRFLQTDPVGDMVGLNLYAFDHNDLINESDPSGAAPRNCTTGSHLTGWNAIGCNYLAGSEPSPDNSAGSYEIPQPQSGPYGKVVNIGSYGHTHYLTFYDKSGRFIRIEALANGEAGSPLIDPTDFVVAPEALGIDAAEFAVTESVSVYRAVSETGVATYIGITNNMERRAAEQLAEKGIAIRAIPGLSNLSRADARAVEQVLIEFHGLQRNGGSLINKINSIAKSNPKYGEAMARGLELLLKAQYQGL